MTIDYDLKQKIYVTNAFRWEHGKCPIKEKVL